MTSLPLLLTGFLTSNAYVASGGRKASLAAILEGQGGQQNRQQISLKLKPIPFIASSGYGRKFFSSGGGNHRALPRAKYLKQQMRAVPRVAGNIAMLVLLSVPAMTLLSTAALSFLSRDVRPASQWQRRSKCRPITARSAGRRSQPLLNSKDKDELVIHSLDKMLCELHFWHS